MSTHSPTIATIAWLLTLLIPVGLLAQTRPLEQASARPDVRQVQAAALRAAGLRAADQQRWSARARLAHLLPTVRGEAAWLDQRDLEISYREDIEIDGEARVTDSRNDYIDDARLRALFALRLEWNLAGLIFTDDELDAARARERRHAARQNLIEQVTELYFQWRHAHLAWAQAPAEPEAQREALALEVARLTAHLDGLTRGWFSRQLLAIQPGGGLP